MQLCWRVVLSWPFLVSKRLPRASQGVRRPFRRENRLGPIYTFDEMKVLARLPNLLLHDEKQS